MIQRQNTQADTVVKQLAANKVRYGAMGDAAGSLVAQAEQDAAGKVNLANGGAGTPGITNKQMASTLSTLIGENGLIDAKDAAEILTKTAGMTDAQRFQFAKNFANSARGVDKTMGDIYGAIAAHNTGGGTAFVQNRPLIGATRQVGGLETTPTPAEMNATVPGVNAQSQPTIRPRVQAAPMFGGSGAPIVGSGQGAAVAGGPASNVTGLSPQDTKIQEERGKGVVEYENELRNTNTAAQEQMRSLTEIRELMKKFKTGGGAEVRMQLAQAASAAGAGDKLINQIAGGDLGALQAAQKLFVKNATDNMKQNMGSAQRFTNLDFSTFLKNSGTLLTQPYGLEKVFNFMTQGAALLRHQQDAYEDWKAGHRPKEFLNGKYKDSDMSSFGSYWTDMLNAARAKGDK